MISSRFFFPARRSPWSRHFATSRPSAAVTDPYKTLGLDRSADKAAIKKAYFNLAKQYHPDSNKDPKAKDRYVEVQEAYEMLKDPAKKEQFDTYGSAGFDTNGNPQNPGFGGGGNPFGAAGFGPGGFNFDDLFSAFGGAARAGARGAAQNQIVVGDAIEVATSISFAEAARGSSKSIRIEPLTKCSPCEGSGLKPGEKKSACLACGGAGTRIHVMQGGFQMQMTCEVCGGAGIVIPRGKGCGSCGGDGVVRTAKTVRVDIPAGIEDGMRLRVAGEGDAPAVASLPGSVHTRNGDLYVHVRIQPSKEFQRDGPNLRHRTTIPMTTAALGGRVRIPTLDGTVEIKVPQGTNTGDAITMAGRGMPRLSTGQFGAPRGSGDLTIEFKVSMPKRISAHERNLLEQLAQSFGDGTARRETPRSDATTTATAEKPGILGSIFDKYRSKTSDEPAGDAARQSEQDNDQQSAKKASSL
ncbi:mdj1 protein precursor [Savitreella phatthalungensis]